MAPEQPDKSDQKEELKEAQLANKDLTREESTNPA